MGAATKPKGMSTAEAETGTGSLSRTIDDLYREYAGHAYRLAYLMTQDREVAGDLVQDAFVRVIARFGHLRRPASFEQYLRRTVVNLANGHFRKQSLEKRYVARQKYQKPQPDDVAEIELRYDLGRRLLQLPPRQRIALVLRYYEDLSEHQIADLLGISARAVNSLVTRGLDKLRQQEGSHDG